MKNNILTLLLIISIGTLIRFIPHPPNFTPIIATFLVSGVFFQNKKLGLIIPFSIMLLSDIFLGLGYVSFWVYLPLLLIYFIGNKFKKLNTLFAVFSSIVFFIISNFGVWLIGYSKTLSGLIACYTLAIPFFINTLLSTVIYSLLFNFLYTKIYKKESNILNEPA